MNEPNPWRRNKPYNARLTGRAKEMRHNPTYAEAQLWQLFLRYHRPRFYRQRPIGNYIAHFYCAKARLVIEIDGDAHEATDIKPYDQWRSSVLNGFGIIVIRFSNNDVEKAFEEVCASISEKVATALRPPLTEGIEGGCCVNRTGY